MQKINEEQVLRTSTSPDSWSGDGLRADSRRIAETIRAFNHATMNRPGILGDVTDAAGVVGGLMEVAERLPQLLGQIGDELERAHAAGYIEGNGDVDKDVAAVKVALDSAPAALRLVQADLERAYRALDRCYASDAFHDAAGDEDEDGEFED